jgi:hypothetical protein
LPDPVGQVVVNRYGIIRIVCNFIFFDDFLEFGGEYFGQEIVFLAMRTGVKFPRDGRGLTLLFLLILTL